MAPAHTSIVPARCCCSAASAAVPDLEVEVHTGGWVADDAALEGADAIAIYADGGAGHPILVGDRLETLGRLMDRGVGFALMHWAVELPVDRGAPQVDRWIGGHYEDLVSCNPMWDARFEHLPEHPITRGVPPFDDARRVVLQPPVATATPWRTRRPSAPGTQVSPILVATPTDAVREGPYVWPHGPYPEVVAASGRPETPAVGGRASRRRSWLRPVGRPLSRQLGERCVPHDRAQRARLADGRGRSRTAGSPPMSPPTTWPVTSTRRGDGAGDREPAPASAIVPGRARVPRQR